MRTNSNIMLMVFWLNCISVIFNSAIITNCCSWAPPNIAVKNIIPYYRSHWILKNELYFHTIAIELSLYKQYRPLISVTVSSENCYTCVFITDRHQHITQFKKLFFFKQNIRALDSTLLHLPLKKQSEPKISILKSSLFIFPQ